MSKWSRGRRSALAAAVRAEWIKAVTVRSTSFALLSFFLSAAGISIAVVASVGAHEASEPSYDPSVIAFYGLNFGHIAIIALAVLLTAGEYSARTAHTTFLAVPRRGQLLAAKLIVGMGLVAATSTVTAFVMLFGTQTQLGSAAVSLSSPGMARSTLCAVLYPTLLAAVCMAAGLLMRDAATALSLLVPFFFLVSPVMELIPGLQRIAVFLPDRAGAIAVRTHSRPVDIFGPIAGLLILTAWAVAAACLAYWISRRRDA
jgi:ABC-2 type transport system permease protein